MVSDPTTVTLANIIMTLRYITNGPNRYVFSG